MIFSQWHVKICHQKHTIKYINKTDVCNTCTHWRLHTLVFSTSHTKLTPNFPKRQIYRTTRSKLSVSLSLFLCVPIHSFSQWRIYSLKIALNDTNRPKKCATLQPLLPITVPMKVAHSQHQFNAPRMTKRKCKVLNDTRKRITVSYKYKMRLGSWQMNRTQFVFFVCSRVSSRL